MFFPVHSAWGKALICITGGALRLSCLFLISKWTTRRIWPSRLCLLSFRKFYWCYFFFRACCLYVENPLGGSIALCVFMHRYAWSWHELPLQIFILFSAVDRGSRSSLVFFLAMFLIELFENERCGVPWPLFRASIRASLRLAHEAIGHWKHFPVLSSRRGIQTLPAVLILYFFGAGPSRVIVVSRTRHIIHIR